MQRTGAPRAPSSAEGLRPQSTHAAPMLQPCASAELVAVELEILRERSEGSDSNTLSVREAVRNECAARLERKISAMKVSLVWGVRCVCVCGVEDECEKGR
eukprot:349889-Chlamydomonas_euryale.AAC.2